MGSLGMQVSEVELIYRSKVKSTDRIRITSSRDAYNVLLSFWNRDKIEFIEEFKVIFLNRAGRVLGILSASSGGVCGTVADPRIIFAAALKICACEIIVSHNHPSGSIAPSRMDEVLTEKLKQGGALLEIKLKDHLIIPLRVFTHLQMKELFSSFFIVFNIIIVAIQGVKIACHEGLGVPYPAL